MPRSSARAKILRDVRELVDDRKEAAILRQQYMAKFSDYDNDVALMEDVIDAHVIDAEKQLSDKRYFFRSKKYRNKRELFDWEGCISLTSLHLNDAEFLLLFRVS